LGGEGREMPRDGDITRRKTGSFKKGEGGLVIESCQSEKDGGKISSIA